MANNSSLSKAKEAKKDEFYTQYEDIQQELNHYEKHFAGKTVLCNCDDPYESNFCKFFLRNFNHLKLKRLICTSYSSSPIVYRQMDMFGSIDESAEKPKNYVMDISELPMANGRGVSDDDIESLLKSESCGVRRLQGDGDFRSEECIEYLKQADIVVTNPPFSLFREYVAQLIEYGKSFLIIGNQNAITYKEIFPLIQNNRMWLGWKFGDMSFRVPDTYEPRETRFWIDSNGQKWRSLGTICWYTNLDHAKRHEKLALYKSYHGNEEEFPKYDNYDAINVDKVSDIPKDYFEAVGVPITFLDKYNPEQFEIVKFRKGNDEKDLTYTAEPKTIQSVSQSVSQSENYTILQNHCQEKAVTALWECLSPSSTSTTQSSLNYSECSTMGRTETGILPQQQSMESRNSRDLQSSISCNGIMGVPITFLDKYNPEQFEIIGRADANIANENCPYHIGGFKDKGGAPLVNGAFVYKRILIKRRQPNEN